MSQVNPAAQPELYGAPARQLIETALQANRMMLRRRICGILRATRSLAPQAVNQEAEDVLAMLCLTALARAERFDTARDVLPWLYGMAFNIARRHMFAERYDRRMVSPEEAAPALAGTLNSEDILDRLSSERRPSAEAEALEHDGLRRLLMSLAPVDRRILWCSAVVGMTADEIGARENLNAAAVRQRLSRARARVRVTYLAEANELADLGGEAAALPARA